jgi:hypothetical protein
VWRLGRTLFVSLPAALLVGAVVAWGASQQPGARGRSGAPRVVFDETVYDFGVVEQGVPVSHVFGFANRGTGDLLIEQVQTSCGCTATVLSSEVIGPGGRGEIRALLDTSGFFGEKARTVMVHTNDPRRPVVTLSLQGEVVAEVAAQPQQLYLGRLRQGEGVTREVDILFDSRKELRVISVENDHPGIHVRTEDLTAEAGRAGKRLVVEVAADMPTGRLNDRILVRTTSAKVPELSIPVFGSVEGDLLVRPPQVSFGILAPGEASVRKVLIKNRGSRPVRILRVESSSAPDVKAEVRTLKEGEEYRLTLRLRRAPAGGPVRGEVRVYTDHPREKVLTIRLYGMVKPPRRQAGR